MQATLPLRRRPLDIIIVVFFIINLGFITYIVDFEQIAVPEAVDPAVEFTEYPVWPPAFLVDLVHWWGKNFDPVLLARPAWWKATIWIDALIFGPFYACAIYAFIRGREWIRLPAIIVSAILWTNVTIIISEEIWGAHLTPALPMVLLANAPWFLFPIFIIARMWREHPFSALERNPAIGEKLAVAADEGNEPL
ncbi:MAG TPA: DUF2781 domain-containing protein [Spirochaetia bacterium]|nr:DUF2781 domain-containing protein [Spirochaetia bacterium]